MKRFYIFAALCLFAGGVFSANAQDMIILRDGNVIEAKVMEVSPTEIRYKRPDHLDGPVRVIYTANVLSIRYENGYVEQFREIAPAARQESPQTGRPGPSDGQLGSSPLQIILNALPAIRIAGNNLKFFFSGDTWTATLNGENFSTGTIETETTGTGAILTLKQTHVWPGAIGRTAGRLASRIPGGAAAGAALNTAGNIAGAAGPIEAPGREFVLEYRAGPPAKLSLVSTKDTAKESKTLRATKNNQSDQQEAQESGQENKPVALKFSLGLVFSVFGQDHTDHLYYYNNPYPSDTASYSYSASCFNLITPMLSLRLLFSLENKLRLGIGFEGAYSLVKVQLTSKNGDDVNIAGYGSFYAILGYSNIYLHAGYDFFLGALFLAPAWAVNKHLLIGFPMSLLGSNQRPFSIIHSLKPPDKQYQDFLRKRETQYYHVGLSIQWVF